MFLHFCCILADRCYLQVEAPAAFKKFSGWTVQRNWCQAEAFVQEPSGMGVPPLIQFSSTLRPFGLLNQKQLDKLPFWEQLFNQKHLDTVRSFGTATQSKQGLFQHLTRVVSVAPCALWSSPKRSCRCLPTSRSSKWHHRQRSNRR